MVKVSKQHKKTSSNNNADYPPFLETKAYYVTRNKLPIKGTLKLLKKLLASGQQKLIDHATRNLSPIWTGIFLRLKDC